MPAEPVALAAPADLHQAPLPCYYRGQNFAYLRVDPRLVGTFFWGVPSTGDAEALIACWSVKIDGAHPPHDSLFDTRAVLGIDPALFQRVGAFVERHRAELPKRIARQALLCTADMQGAVVAGFPALFRLAYPTGLFADLRAALRFFERDDAEELAPQLERFAAHVAVSDAALSSLRAWLADPAVLPGATLERAAAALGSSARTLQRRLTAGGTSFLAELSAARIAAARTLLVAPGAKVAAVARLVGFASEQHFVAMFRRWTGETPGHFRARLAGALEER